MVEIDLPAAASEAARSECSLCVLTSQFLKYMSKSGGKAVDLKQAATTLQTRKRRIYDVTNVLEGVGLIEKSGTNNVQWCNRGENAALGMARFRFIHRNRLQQLQALNARMQACTDSLNTCIDALTSAPQNQELLYVTKQDLISLDALDGHQLMAVKAPPGSTMTIPDPHHGTGSGRQRGPEYRAVVSSQDGPLSVWLITGHQESAVNGGHDGGRDGAGDSGLEHTRDSEDGEADEEHFRSSKRMNRSWRCDERPVTRSKVGNADGFPVAAPGSRPHAIYDARVHVRNHVGPS